MIQNFRAPFLVAVNNHFGIRVCAKTMAAFSKFSPQLFEVVDLAVQDDPDCFLCIRHRLVASGQIDDRETAKAETNRAIEKVALVVGTAMPNLFGHSPNRVRFDRLVPDKVKLAADAAHCLEKLTS